MTKPKSISEMLLSSPHENDYPDLFDLTEELSHIKSPEIRTFTHAVLSYADAFWISPSTLDGETHPPDEKQLGGLVTHTKRVVRAVALLCNTFICTELEQDYLISAALIHDVSKAVFKDSKTREILHDPLHAYTIDPLIDWAGSQNTDSSKPNVHDISNEDRSNILRLVRCSHGFWSIVPETVPVTNLEKILHIADLIATNIHIILDGFEIKEERWNVLI